MKGHEYLEDLLNNNRWGKNYITKVHIQVISLKQIIQKKNNEQKNTTKIFQ